MTWFHWTGIDPALSDNMVQICEQACKKAREKGIIISCDLNFRKNLWSSEKAQEVMRNLVQYVDVCIANEEDADKVLGIKAPKNNVESGKLNKNLAKRKDFHIHRLLKFSHNAVPSGISARLYCCTFSAFPSYPRSLHQGLPFL